MNEGGGGGRDELGRLFAEQLPQHYKSRLYHQARGGERTTARARAPHTNVKHHRENTSITKTHQNPTQHRARAHAPTRAPLPISTAPSFPLRPIRGACRRVDEQLAMRSWLSKKLWKAIEPEFA